MARTLFTTRSQSYGGDQIVARRQLGEEIRLDLQFMEQIHGGEVSVISKPTAQLPKADALVTSTPGIGLAVLVADCLPILIDGGDVVAAVHAGRKGLVLGVIRNAIEVMCTLTAKPLDSFLVQIGPSICSTCYEVSPDMYAELTKSHPAMATNDEAHSLDLQAEAKSQLLALGISAANIHDWQRCTLESPYHFSYRGGDLLDRQIGLISL